MNGTQTPQTPRSGAGTPEPRRGESPASTRRGGARSAGRRGEAEGRTPDRLPQCCSPSTPRGQGRLAGPHLSAPGLKAAQGLPLGPSPPVLPASRTPAA